MEPAIITIKHLVSEAQCYAAIRQLRWQEGITCPHCGDGQTVRRGFAGPQRHGQRYQCKACNKRFDDLTGTVLAGHHQPLSVWLLCLYFIGLNLSNAQIAQELDLNKDDLREVAIRLLDNVRQAAINPLILHSVAPGTLIYTDEYNIYGRLETWGFQHKTVNRSAGEYARDGFCEVHSNTIVGFWSLLRSWLRPHRGISQAKLPLYLSFFDLVS